MNKPKFYNPPKDIKGNPIWVPLVIKNKDALIGFIWGINLSDSIYGIDRDSAFESLSSLRFNDITKSGKRLRDMTNKEFFNYAESLLQNGNDRCDALNSKDNVDCDLADYVFTLSCSCGNFMGYRNNKDIPNKDTNCDLCGNQIIHYTKTDDVFIYDGISGRNNDSVFSIINALTEDEEDSEDDDDASEW